MSRRLVLAFVVSCQIALLLLIQGCARKQAAKGQETPSVSISQILEKDSRDYEDFTGRTAAVESVEVKARATGYLQEIKFKEGDEVKKGQLLYEIDPRTYQADLDRAKGEVSRLEASLERFNADLARARRMRVSDAMSREDYDKAVAHKGETAAAMDSAKAMVEKAKLNLEFCKVYSPIDGQISKTLITRGNLVTQDQTTLTNVVSVAPIYVYFDVDERTALRIGQKIREKKLKSYREAAFPVFVGTQIDEGYPHEGIIDFVDNKLDANTGTLRVRGIFPNKDRALTPELFVRVRVPIGEKQKTLLVSDRAVGTDQGQKVLYVVKDNVVEQHPVLLGSLRDGLRVIESGVDAGDWVIVSGLQRVRAGMKVESEKVKMPMPPPPPKPIPQKK